MAAPAGDGRARLVVSARVVFTGPVFSMRGLIESSSLEARPCARLHDALQDFQGAVCPSTAACPGLPVCGVAKHCCLSGKDSVQRSPSSLRDRARQVHSSSYRRKVKGV